MKKTYYYILFDSHEQAVKLHSKLSEEGIRLIVSPTPRVASTCCGVSLMVPESKYEQVVQYLDTHSCEYKEICKVEQEFNKNRDVYI